MINGGLGLQLADNSRAGKIVYGVVVGLVGGMYFVFLTAFELKVLVSGREIQPHKTQQEVENKSEQPVVLNGPNGV
jgi:hypothetical protein